MSVKGTLTFKKLLGTTDWQTDKQTNKHRIWAANRNWLLCECCLADVSDVNNLRNYVTQVSVRFWCSLIGQQVTIGAFWLVVRLSREGRHAVTLRQQETQTVKDKSVLTETRSVPEARSEEQNLPNSVTKTLKGQLLTLGFGGKVHFYNILYMFHLLTRRDFE